MNKINRDTPVELHLIVDNYALHKNPKIHAWGERSPRFHFRFTLPFTWTADRDAIIKKVRRGKLVLNDLGVAR